MTADDTDFLSDEEWQELVVKDVAGLLDEEDRALLREDDSLARWRAALVVYQRRLEDKRRSLRSRGSRDGGALNLVGELLQAIQQRFTEQRRLQKAANLRKQRNLKAEAKQRRRNKELERQQRAASQQIVRDSQEGKKLSNAIFKRALRLNNWAARLVEEMELDNEDPEWSRWLDQYAATAEMVERFEAMVDTEVESAPPVEVE